MNKEKGIITRTRGNIAWVKVRRSSMCEVCNSKNICSTLSDENTMEAEVYNPVNAKVDDMVEFMISTSSLLKITTLLYIVPVIFLLAGAISGFSYFSPPEFYALIFGLFGFFLSYFIIKFISQIMTRKRKFTPEIIRIL
ncbi:MAG: SoxR reducing system RseC family protein [Acidobacteriota bacterium]